MVKNNLRRDSPSTMETMTEDKLEGTGLLAHGLVFLGCKPYPSIYILSLGVETWSKSLHKVGFTRKARVLLGLQGQTPEFPASGARRQGSWRLAPGLRKTSFCAFQKPRGLSPLAQIKCSRAQTFWETSGTPSDEFRNPSGDQTLLSHISIFIFGSFRSSSSCP